jgi:lambda repressor-like predicted transcriptional regulator
LTLEGFGTSSARTSSFNWHRDVILAMLRQRGIKSLLVRALFR